MCNKAVIVSETILCACRHGYGLKCSGLRALVMMTLAMQTLKLAAKERKARDYQLRCCHQRELWCCFVSELAEFTFKS